MEGRSGGTAVELGCAVGEADDTVEDRGGGAGDDDTVIG